MKRIKALIMTLAVLLGFGGAVIAPAVSYASPKSEVCGAIAENASCSGTPKNGINLNGVIKAAINLMSVLIGVISVIMIMVSGFRYVTSGGDSSKVSGAKGTLIYAIVGLVIVAFAQAIVQFVLNRIK